MTIKDHVVPALLTELAETRKTMESRITEIERKGEERVAELRDNLRRMLSPESLNTIPPTFRSQRMISLMTAANLN